ncbi:MAG: hypothetical protein WC352_01225 [Candidatus Omnitrophota bacterium]|jgi:hypothetical protein
MSFSRFSWILVGLLLSLSITNISCSGGTPSATNAYSVDLDGDGNKEHISGFQIYNHDDIPTGILRVSSADKKVIAEVELGDHYTGLDFVSLNKDKTKQIFALSMSGAHQSNLAIYSLKNGQLVELFAKGSAAGVEYKEAVGNNPPEIRVGRANWDDPEWSYATGKRLWEVYVWDGEKFEYSQSKSTSPLKSEREETSAYGQQYLKFVGKGKSSSDSPK